MSLTAAITPRTMALVGNPIRLDITSTSPVSYTIKCADSVVFQGSGEGNFFVFLEEILASIVSPTRYVGAETDVRLATVGNIKKYTVEVCNTENNKATLEHIAVIGGVSKRALRHLQSEGSNIFTFKLLNDAGNFLMSSRTQTRILEIRETELLPLLFIAPGANITIKAKEGVQKVITTTKGTCYALNIKAVRSAFATENRFFASYFDIYVGTTKSLTLVITPCEVEKERYYLDFLNSYGAYECIEVTGKPLLDQEKAEDKKYNVYDVDINDYVSTRERVSSTDSLTVQTGFKGEQELLFLLDMLASDDIRLIGYEDREIKVHATAESLAFAKNMTEPQSLQIKLTFTDKEQFQTGALLGVDFDNPRIHTPEFSTQFN